MADFEVPCPECEYRVIGFNRGARGSDPGAGVEAANLMDAHMAACHPDHGWRPEARVDTKEPK